MRRGVEVVFLTGEPVSRLHALLDDPLASFVVIESPVTTLSNGDGQDRTPEEQVRLDAFSTAKALGTGNIDIIVLDHYSLSDTWLKMVKELTGSRSLAIDDCGRHWTSADVILDSALDSAGRYEVHHETQIGCFGPSFAPLGPQYRAIPRRVLTTRIEHRVSVFFGGSDEFDATGMALEAIRSIEGIDLKAHTVLGEFNPNSQQLREKFSSDRFVFEEPGDTMFQQLLDSTICVGAGGTTTWERLCMGVPSIVLSTAQNQEVIAEQLGREDYLRYLGSVEDVKESDLTAAILQLLRDDEMRRLMSLRSQLLVDGLGSFRISEIMLPSTGIRVFLRKAVVDDTLFGFRIISSDRSRWFGTRPAAAESAVNSWDAFCRWFGEEVVSQRGDRVVVAEMRGVPVGLVLFEVVNGAKVLPHVVMDETMCQTEFLMGLLEECRVWCTVKLGSQFSFCRSDPMDDETRRALTRINPIEWNDKSYLL